MVIRIIGSLFTSSISIASDSSHEVVIVDCQFSSFDSVSELALNVVSEGNCFVFRCCFSDIVFWSLAGYNVKARRADCREISISNLSLYADAAGGVVQCLECDETSLKSVNVTGIMVEHICFASLQNGNVSTASFLNAFDLVASVRGVGIQYNGITKFASLQFANFVKITSPILGIVRSVYSAITLYATYCFFAQNIQGQMAFYGDSPIRVSACSSSVSSLIVLNVSIFDSLEIPRSLEVFVRTRVARQPSYFIRKRSVISVVFLTQFGSLTL